ncbi:hypothetical protein EDB89DRAFT_1906126 [Lactarius sanguifluus]|nr:hypothetical protein EDB89DRAFT_1906126 [Lactarius sanguifluus]
MSYLSPCLRAGSSHHPRHAFFDRRHMGMLPRKAKLRATMTAAAGDVLIHGGDSTARKNLCIHATGARGMYYLQSRGLEVPEQAYLSNYDHIHETTTTATATEATTRTGDEVSHMAMATIWAYYS